MFKRKVAAVARLDGGNLRGRQDAFGVGRPALVPETRAGLDRKFNAAAFAATRRLRGIYRGLARAATARLVSTDYPRRGRGVAATRLRGISASQPRRRRDPATEFLRGERTRSRRRASATRAARGSLARARRRPRVSSRRRGTRAPCSSRSAWRGRCTGARGTCEGGARASVPRAELSAARDRACFNCCSRGTCASLSSSCRLVANRALLSSLSPAAARSTRSTHTARRPTHPIKRRGRGVAATSWRGDDRAARRCDDLRMLDAISRTRRRRVCATRGLVAAPARASAPAAAFLWSLSPSCSAAHPTRRNWSPAAARGSAARRGSQDARVRRCERGGARHPKSVQHTACPSVLALCGRGAEPSEPRRKRGRAKRVSTLEALISDAIDVVASFACVELL